MALHRALRRMAGLVFLLVFWALAGACQRHGVGVFLFCNSSSSMFNSPSSPHLREQTPSAAALQKLPAGLFKQLPVYINSSLPSQTRKLRNFETTWPCAFHATSALVSLFPCLPRHRAPGMEAESTSVGSEERLFFLHISIVLTCIFQCEKMRNGMTAMRLFADGCLFEDLREAIGSQTSWR